MNCNCIKELEQKLAKHYGEQLGVTAKVECQDVALILTGNIMTSRLKNAFQVTAQAKGFIKGKVIPVTGSYCPFCGKAATPTPAKPATEAA